MFEVRGVCVSNTGRVSQATRAFSLRSKKRWRAKRKSSAGERRHSGWICSVPFNSPLAFPRVITGSIASTPSPPQFQAPRGGFTPERPRPARGSHPIQPNPHWFVEGGGVGVVRARALSRCTTRVCLTENEAKKTRAEKRAGEEARATVQKLEEITDQAEQFEQLRMVRCCIFSKSGATTHVPPLPFRAGGGEPATASAEARALPEVHAGGAAPRLARI